MARRRLIEIALPASVAVTPVLVGAARDWSHRSRISFWGDQALIDIEARDSLLGRNLLGVYDRYGWHHLGPLWLCLLGVARWLGSGSEIAVSIGFYFLQALAIVGVVAVAHRLRPGLTGWWAALVLVAYQWSYGLERLGTVWAPYAIALPAALLVLLVADIVASRDPWPSTLPAAVCATFLCQTDVGTLVVVLVLIVATPLLRVTIRPGSKGWGWGTRHWRSRAATLAAVLGALWLAPVVQQLSTRPGNLVQAYRFFTTHHAVRALSTSMRAADTVFGLFPFRTDERLAVYDARPGWLETHSALSHPWYLLYLAGVVVVGVVALKHRKLPALATAAATGLAILAAGWSVLLVYGPLYPYLVLWMGALVIPAWVALWLLLAPLVAPLLAPLVASARTHRLEPGRRLMLPLASVVLAAVICAVFAGGRRVPLTDWSSHLSRRAWSAVASASLAPGVRKVYVDIASGSAMPVAAAIADQLVRHHLQVDVNRKALYYLDPSFAPHRGAQLRVVVCCPRGDPPLDVAHLDLRARVGGEAIYTQAVGRSPSHGRKVRGGYLGDA